MLTQTVEVTMFQSRVACDAEEFARMKKVSLFLLSWEIQCPGAPDQNHRF